MARAFVLVMDSFGVGAAPDAERFGDAGADTLGHIAAACAQETGENASNRNSGPLRLPFLSSIGLGEAARLATGKVPHGLEAKPSSGKWGVAREISWGKDTPSGHWEMAGVPIEFDWRYFPRTIPAFPDELTRELAARCGLPGFLGDKHASGTEIIKELGEEHVRTGKPIIYTSADSVFQIAAHEEAFGLDRLYEVCEAAFDLVAPMNVGRVIARPFLGTCAEDFKRTGHRRDYSIAPPSTTLLEHAANAGRDVVSIGKIGDIFAHIGTGREIKADGAEKLWRATFDSIDTLADGGLLMTNFVDFDQLYGHRRDIFGYARALEDFDAEMARFSEAMRPDDIAIITADHGCDPTWRGTDHTREYVPVLCVGPSVEPGCIGVRSSFSDIAATISAHLDLEFAGAGKPWPLAA
jgi:phosphopentomutase